MHKLSQFSLIMKEPKGSRLINYMNIPLNTHLFSKGLVGVCDSKRQASAHLGQANGPDCPHSGVSQQFAQYVEEELPNWASQNLPSKSDRLGSLRPIPTTTFCGSMEYFWKLLFIFDSTESSLPLGLFSLVAASGGYSLAGCMGFSLRWLLVLHSTSSRAVGFQKPWLPGSRAWVQ